ncbi:5-(carboxyamino)imidazole ribonucleotide synthase [Francisellaceae bacterium]|nr:5-(carboxyamino)imidazole ribonucleotide synthase [Francisellaceae bacterium]
MKIAILGNGQLAAMMHEVSAKLNLETIDFPLPEIKADGSCTESEISNWVEKLKSFDVVTYEIENIPVALLKEVNKSVPVYPAISALETAQDRLAEKQAFTALGIKTNQFMTVDSKQDLQQAASDFRFPFIIKTRRFGYDGKGQYVLKSVQDINLAWSELGEHALLAESFVPFDYEVSQIAARSVAGDIVFYPLVRNEHREGILRETHVLDFPEALTQQAQQAIQKVLTHFDYVGTLAIEFFVKDNVLYVNEMAPRVHNSGHWSIDGAETSQFENHLRGVAGQKLGATTVTSNHVIMINLIGEDVTDGRLESFENVYLKSYGKSVRTNRKMGHINVISDSETEFKNTVDKVYALIEAEACL